MIIILFAMFLLQISFISDLGAQAISPSLYTSESNPVSIPIGSDVSATATTYESTLTSNPTYGSIISVNKDTTSTTAATFDQNFLFPIKLTTPKIKGGIFFNDATTSSGLATTQYGFTTLVNTKTPTSPFVLTNIATEAIIRNIFTTPTISIKLTSHPLPRTASQLAINNTISGFFASFIFSLALAFKFASIISFIVKEREDRSKHQQIVSGMMVSAYWFANFIYDFILYCIVMIFSVGIIKAFSITSLTSNDAYAATWLLFIFYGVAYIFLTYILAYLYKDYGNAQAGHYFMTFIIGGMLPILTFLLRILGESSGSIGKGLAWFLRLYPAFAFG